MDRVDINKLLLWFLAVLFFSYQFILRLSPGVLIDEMMIKYHINASTFGLITAFYYIGYAGMQIPVGALLDRFGVRYVVASGAMICVLGNICLLLSDYWLAALIGRFIIGMGSTAGVLGAIQAVRVNFSRQYMSKMIGATVALSIFGAIYGKSINRYLFDNMGMDESILYLSLPGVLIAFCILLFPKDSKSTLVAANKNISMLGSLKEVLKIKQVIWLAFAGALMVGPLEAFADIFGESYFIAMYDFTPEESGYLSASAIYFGICVGAPILAIIADKYNCHYLINIICGLVMVGAFHIILEELITGYSLMFICTFIIGVMSAYQVIVISMVLDLVPISLNGITVAIVNMFNMAAGMVYNIVIGGLLDYYWTGGIADGKRVYSEVAYTDALYILPVTLMFGVILFFVLRPSEAKQTNYSPN